MGPFSVNPRIVLSEEPAGERLRAVQLRSRDATSAGVSEVVRSSAFAQVGSGVSGPTALFGMLLLASISAIAPIAAKSPDEYQYEKLHAPILAEWERWADVRLGQGIPRSYAPVVDAYLGVVSRWMDEPLESRETAAIQSHIGLLWLLSYSVFAIPREDLGGFSPVSAYGEALLLWNELERRGEHRTEDAERLVDMAIGARDFETALGLNESKSLGHKLPAGVHTTTGAQSDSGAPVWRLDEQGWLSKGRFEFPPGLHWVVTSNESCGFSLRLARDVGANAELNELFAGSLTWLISPDPRLDLSLVNEARLHLQNVEPVWMHVIDDWSMFDDLFGSPIVHLMRDSEVLQAWIGWPSAAERVPEMVAAWQSHQD